jgi:hypothetical protein
MSEARAATPDEVLQRHRANSPEPGMIRPDYQGYATCNVSQLVLRNFGLPNRCPEVLHPLLDRTYSRVVLLILDALGWNQLHTFLPDIPPLQRLYERSTVLPITTTFPSTTTVALTTIYTGLTPAEHTVTGHYIYLKELGAVVDVLRFSPLGDPRREVYAERGVDVHELFPMYTVFEPLKKAGLGGLSITRGIFTNTALGWLHHVGADVIGYLTGADMMVHLKRALAGGGKPGLIVCYWDVVDMLSHEYRPFSDEVRSAVDQFFYSLEREIRDAIPTKDRRDTLLLLTADHGQCDVPPEEAVCLSEHPGLRELVLLPPTGQNRAPYLYAEQGAAEKLGERLHSLEHRIIPRKSEDMLSQGYWGPPEHAGRIRARVGDYTAIGRGGTMLYGTETRRESLRLKGHHGSLTENEMLVPFIALPLEAW